MFPTWGEFRTLYYVNKEDISCVPSSFWHYHRTNQANQAALTALGGHIGTTAVCVFCRPALFVWSICLCVDRYWLSVYVPVCWKSIHVNIHLRFPLKVQSASDLPKLRAPEVEPWRHPFHRSGPPSSRTPTPHAVSITRTLRITRWRKTRVCSWFDWARNICSMLSMNRQRSSMRFRRFRNVVETGTDFM